MINVSLQFSVNDTDGMTERSGDGLFIDAGSSNTPES